MTTRKKIKLLIVAAALTLPVWAASAATAGPDCDKLPPDHPKCTTTSTTSPTPDHPDGVTCAEALTVYGADHETVTLTDGTDGTPLTVGTDPVCIDWTTTIASKWVVTVTDPGDAKSVNLSLRDSHPGDFCWLGTIDLKRDTTQVTISHSNGPNATGGAIPVSIADACGDEYIDSSDPYVLTIRLGGKPTAAEMTIEPAS